MNAKQRRILLFTMLAGAVVWSAWLALDESADDAPADVAEPALRGKRVAAASPAASAADPAPAHAATTRLGLAHGNLFPQQTWFVAPPPPPPMPPPPPPPPPQAPALPFSYMGQWQEGGASTYYLTRGDLPVAVRVGQVLDGAWRLEAVNGTLLNFTYLPLNQTRSLRMGD